jgi:hypothetical protein
MLPKVRILHGHDCARLRPADGRREQKKCVYVGSRVDGPQHFSGEQVSLRSTTGATLLKPSMERAGWLLLRCRGGRPRHRLRAGMRTADET